MTEEEIVEKVARVIEDAQNEDRYGLYDYSQMETHPEPFMVKDHLERKTLLRSSSRNEAQAFYAKLIREYPARAAIAAMKEAGAVFPAVTGPEPDVKTLSQEETAAAVFSVLNHPTRI